MLTQETVCSPSKIPQRNRFYAQTVNPTLLRPLHMNQTKYLERVTQKILLVFLDRCCGGSFHQVKKTVTRPRKKIGRFSVRSRLINQVGWQLGKGFFHWNLLCEAAIYLFSIYPQCVPVWRLVSLSSRRRSAADGSGSSFFSSSPRLSVKERRCSFNAPSICIHPPFFILAWKNSL